MARRGRLRRGLAVALATAVSSTGMAIASTGAAVAATPVYEITGTWVNPPEAISRGNPVVAEWRVNVNDADEPPSNEPVDNVTATFTVAKAFFDEIPDMCRTDGVTPPSSISADGASLTCNFGTVVMGTALVVQTPVVADGLTGDEVTLGGTSPGGEQVDLPPIPIENPFVMDIHYGTNTAASNWNDAFTAVDADIQWSLRLGSGSDPGPDEVTYRLNVADSNGANVNVGVNPRTGVAGCGRFDVGSADGHPWSREDIAPTHPRNANFVAECLLTEVSPGAFDLTLRGIDYSLLDAPTQDSRGGALPPAWNYVASGSLWFRVITDEPGSISLTSNAPTYTAPTGQTYTDPAANNRTNKSYTLPGGWHAAWHRAYTGSGGPGWDDTYRVSAGTSVRQYANNAFVNDNVPNNAQYGNCLALDTRYLTLAPNGDIAAAQVVASYGVEAPAAVIDTIPIEYYTGGNALLDPASAQYDPNAFTCDAGGGGWSTTAPADLSSVRALRIRYPFSQFAAEGAVTLQLRAHTQIDPDVPVGQDVWMFGSALRNGTWLGTGAPWDTTQVITPTPDARYPFTNGRRDIVRIITATPFIEKSAASATVTPGVPAEFTLTYSANGSGIIPPTVDGYTIRDVLPLGMTYEPDSASPEPVVTVDDQGRQVLTWTLDGVATNTPHELTYQAVADASVEPGTQLTNTATSSYGGETSPQVSETVTTTTNGYTTILKTGDPEYIPNVNEDGAGTGSWTVTIESHDPLPQAFTDTIDILPYNGDQRGTDYGGTYTLSDVVLADGGTVYYTDADPATLSDDPADPANGAPNTPSALWTTTKPANPTAVRVIGGELAPGGTFAFQVVIETEGAQAGDVYVNRAQARAEHTALVMRTSAPLYVSDYSVAKTSDPAPGSTVKPGDTVTYTITVTQEGPVPAAAAWTDTLEGVLDDAVYNEDATADIGTVTYADGVLSWEGVVPVGEVATITYTVTVKDVAGLTADGADTVLDNSVWSVGCDEPAGGEADPCEPPPLVVGWYEYSKTADPVPGSTVQPGDVITYTVLIEQHGEGAVTGAFLTDDLTGVLDDATWNDDAAASTGAVTFTDPTLTWNGDLAVGDVVTLTYSVTATTVGSGDDQLHNIVTSICETDDPDCLPGICVPAPDENPNCETEHVKGDWVISKTSDPVTGSEVEVGDIVTYTVTLTQVGVGAIPEAGFTDDLTQVLDDATYNGDAVASSGPEPTYEDPALAWSGPLAVGEVVTVTYSVTVTAEGDRLLKNVVTPTDPDACVPVEGQDEACTTEHVNGQFTYSKTSDPAPGSLVEEGDVVTYTVLISQVGTAPVEDATIDDDLSAVLDDATWNDDAAASAGEVSFTEPTLTWTGDLAVGEVVTLTYSVTVGPVEEGDDELTNVVTSPHPDGVCVPAPDENPDCTTTHVLGDYVVTKTSDPESGATVEDGDVVTYTVTVTHTGGAPVEATFDDDLSGVLDDATWNDDVSASAGEATLDATTLTWTGDLVDGDVVTITYSVTVTSDGDRHLKNVVTTPDPDQCVPAEGQDEACTTEHFSGGYTYSKTSDPAPGSDVEEGDVITYTVLVQQVGPAPVTGATVTDDLSGVSPYADWNDDASATSGEVSLSGDTLTWTGDLAVGQAVTITYSVTVGDEENATLRNVVTSPDDDATCVPAPDENPGCRTEHHTPGARPPAPDGDLPGTGTGVIAWFVAGGAALLIGGLVLALTQRRRFLDRLSGPANPAA